MIWSARMPVSVNAPSQASGRKLSCPSGTYSVSASASPTRTPGARRCRTVASTAISSADSGMRPSMQRLHSSSQAPASAWPMAQTARSSTAATASVRTRSRRLTTPLSRSARSWVSSASMMAASCAPY